MSGMPAPASSSEHRPEIDGLRTLAVLAVLFFHAQFPAFTGGFVGVDVFFVLSGFLIGRQLSKTDANGRIDLAGFYERRFRRIFPAIVPCLVFAWIGAWLLFNQTQFADFSKSLIASSLFGANLYFWSSAGYFDGPSDMKPLLHMWSLGVEVQYYIAFSLMIAVAARFKMRFLPVTLAAGALSLACALWLMHTGAQDSAFYLPHARFWEMLAGSVLGFLPLTRMRPAFADVLEIAGLALILVPIFLYDGDTPFPGLAALPPVLGTAMIVAAANQGRLVSNLLATRPMQHIGAVSYSLYLWHLPLIVFARFVFPTPGPLIMVAALVLSYLLALFSYTRVEAPFRKRSFLTKRTLSLGYMGIVAFTGILVIVLAGRGMEAKRQNYVASVRAAVSGPERQMALQAINAAEIDYQTHLNLNYDGRTGAFDPARHRDWTCSYDEGNTPAAVTNCLLSQAAPRNVLVLGDSNGRDTLHALRLAFPGVNFLMYHQSGCPPLDAEISPGTHCFAGYKQVMAQLKASMTIDMVILAFRYRPQDAANAQAAVVAALEEARGQDTKVVLFGPRPLFRRKVADFVLARPPGEALAETVPFSAADMFTWDLSELNRQSREMAQRLGVTFISMEDGLCDAEGCSLWDGSHDRPIYWDNNHLSRAGMEHAARYLQTTSLASLLQQPAR